MVSYEEGLKTVWRGLGLLAIITVGEVFVALLGKGHIIENFYLPIVIMYSLMISMSLYKAYFIVKFFMQMGYEVRGMAMSVLLPCLLLVWAIIAFFWEGSYMGYRRELIQKKNERVIKPVEKTTGAVFIITNDALQIS